MSSNHATRRLGLAVVTLISLGLLAGAPALATENLTEMSLEDLMNVTVTSASKREENKFDAAAAITVLTSEEIRRSGATSVPELLRNVPGLNVARIDASRWAISARGYNGQFANKMLVLIDGRSVYTPLFGGVYWDVQDVVLSDIDRIEVIRGPGGTLWGANAVNGVINITTKSAKKTQGVHATGVAGNQEYIGEGRFGGMIGDHTGYRVYAKGFKRDDFTYPSGSGAVAHDEWWQWRVGARIDSELSPNDDLTIQGDFYDGQNEAVDETLTPVADTKPRGGNVLARWNHALSEKQSTEVQVYYDFTQRDSGTISEDRNNVDVLFQHDFVLGSDDQWLFNWGTEYMWSSDELFQTPGGITFNPGDQDFHRFSGFVQAQWNLFGDRLELTAGTKLEWNNYTDFEYQPTGRALWKFLEGNAVWASISRAVRAPTRVDRDLEVELDIPPAPPVQLVLGNKDINSENLLAYEFGYRNHMLANVTLDLSLFYNDYDDLVVMNPIAFTNDLESRAWGGEFEVAWQPLDDVRFVTSYAYLQIEDDVPPFPAQLVFGPNDGSSPQHTWMLRGFWNVPVIPVEVDSTVWYVSKLSARTVVPTGGSVSSYWRLDARVAWQVVDQVSLEVVGQNLTEQRHAEWGTAGLAVFPGTWVPRSYYGKVTIDF